GVVAALLAVAGRDVLAGALVPPEAALPLLCWPARARPSAVPPAASRKARASTTGSRAPRRRERPGPGRPGAVGPGTGPAGPVTGACQFWARMVWVGLS